MSIPSVSTGLDPRFMRVVGYLAACNSQNSAGVATTVRRHWVDFTGVEGVDPIDIYDSEAIHALFDRREATERMLNAQKLKAQSKDSAKEVIAIETLAAVERCFRARYRSRLRSFVHQAAAADTASGNRGPLRMTTTGLATKVAQRGV